VETPFCSARILLVSRDPETLRCLAAVGEANSWQLEATRSGLEALERVQSAASPDLVLLDLIPDDSDSLHTLRWLRKVRPRLPVILLSQSDDHQRMMEALRLGARDFIIKPCSPQQLDEMLKAQLKSINQTEATPMLVKMERVKHRLVFVAASSSMKELRTQAELLAQVNKPVLIVGERGSGKRTVAQLIHQLSGRLASRFAQVNCNSFAAEQLEKEIFGTDGGALNNANVHRLGKFELCNRGTLLLGEISAMPSALQFKMLSALKNQSFQRKDEKTILGVRLLGTNTIVPNSEKSAGNGGGDLMHSLGAFTIHVPPLRQRARDIPVLLEHFMHRLAQHHRLPARKFSDVALEGCMRYSWPDNLHSLENFVKAYLILGDESLRTVFARGTSLEDSNLYTDHVLHSKPYSTSRFMNSAFPPDVQIASLKSLVSNVKKETERGAIAGALEQTHWNRKAAARLLQISYRALLYKISEYQMAPPEGYFATLTSQSATKTTRN
jgi:two-component system, NtrC family, response regulator AtoC